jgi:probable HAF family extracellular repeat protein
MVGLGYLPGGGDFSYATAISADGSVIVGSSDSVLGDRVAYRWTAATGMVALGTISPPGVFYSSALDVSGDGRVVVGNHGVIPIAFRWTATGGVQDLENPLDLPFPNDYANYALATSGDGSIVVGTASAFSVGTDSHAVVWDEQGNARLLSDLLRDLGANVDGWTLRSATDISADGRVIVGNGTSPDGIFQVWRAVIPEPSPAALLALGLIALSIRRRRLH